ncbi:hypothetical protein KCU85_g7, partial [Aureobasidium melanogenum]
MLTSIAALALSFASRTTRYVRLSSSGFSMPSEVTWAARVLATMTLKQERRVVKVSRLLVRGNCTCSEQAKRWRRTKGQILYLDTTKTLTLSSLDRLSKAFSLVLYLHRRHDFLPLYQHPYQPFPPFVIESRIGIHRLRILSARPAFNLHTDRPLGSFLRLTFELTIFKRLCLSLVSLNISPCRSLSVSGFSGRFVCAITYLLDEEDEWNAMRLGGLFVVTLCINLHELVQCRDGRVAFKDLIHFAGLGLPLEYWQNIFEGADLGHKAVECLFLGYSFGQPSYLDSLALFQVCQAHLQDFIPPPYPPVPTPERMVLAALSVDGDCRQMLCCLCCQCVVAVLS